MAVDVAYDGEAALERAGVNDYDVLVLDRDLPVVHGDRICQAIVAAGGNVKVLMLTAATEIADRVEGLGLGADDYLTKPFALAELRARVLALGRRSRPAPPRSPKSAPPAARRSPGPQRGPACRPSARRPCS